MNKQEIRERCAALFSEISGNIMRETDGIDPRYAGTAMFESPLVGFGAADDPLFEGFKAPTVIGPWHMSPTGWQTGAKTVISLFFPMSDAVIESNRNARNHASELWVYARIEGQVFINAYTKALCRWFAEQGYEACGPCIDPRFRQVSAGKGMDGHDYPEINEKTFGSRWSERHAAYVCGLGTFGLSKGLITRRGMAGRFTSIIVTAPLEADERPYSDVYEYCIRCGACARRCPAQAISTEAGKDHTKCGRYLENSKAIHHPRYGCGLCQTRVPCERGIPWMICIT